MEVWDFAPPPEGSGERSFESDSMELDVGGEVEGDDIEDGSASLAPEHHP